MKVHEPIYFKKLSPAERADLGSITKHPGMDVFLEKILKGHCDQQLLQIMEVPPDDPNRQVKLNAISETAYSMQLFLELARQELGLNWKYLEAEELRRHKEAEKNAEELRKGNERTSY